MKLSISPCVVTVTKILIKMMWMKWKHFNIQCISMEISNTPMTLHEKEYFKASILRNYTPRGESKINMSIAIKKSLIIHLYFLLNIITSSKKERGIFKTLRLIYFLLCVTIVPIKSWPPEVLYDLMSESC